MFPPIFPARMLAVALSMVLVIGACASGSDREPDEGGRISITIDGIAYEPEIIAVDAGEEITWSNEDVVAHTVTSGRQAEQGVPGVSRGSDAHPDGLFDGRLDEDGDTFAFTFERPGTYAYFCEIHVGMIGEVVVN